MKDHPDRVRLVQADLEEVVAASQRAELGQGLVDLLVGEDAVRGRQVGLGGDHAAADVDPTAAGIRAEVVGITLPTVAPSPKWASAMRAMCPLTTGRREERRAWLMVRSSSCEAQLTSLSEIRFAPMGL